MPTSFFFITFSTFQVEQLRKRLEVAQAENEQLEEMLKREEARALREGEMARRLAAELSELQVCVAAIVFWSFFSRHFANQMIFLSSPSPIH